MRWASAITQAPDLETALTDTETELRLELGNLSPHLLVVFASPHFAAVFDQIPPLLSEIYNDALVVGCSASGVIGGGEELEHQPALSITAAFLPDVHIVPFHMTNSDIPTDLGDVARWEDLIGIEQGSEASLLLMADGHTFDIERCILGLDLAFPSSEKIGGLASGLVMEQTSLFLGRRRVTAGAIGIAMYGNIEVDTIVAQGCRPIGSPMFITGCDRNVLRELDGDTPATVLERLHRGLDPDDKELFREAIFLGIVMNDLQEKYQRGDFLIRNILGVELESVSLVVGAELQANQVVQFHLRDAQTSHGDLAALLDEYRQDNVDPPAGCLLFSCVARGAQLYGRPNHDSDVLQTHIGPTPLGGFFCNGEIGPVRGRTYLHGYTSCFALFRPKRPPVH